MTLEDERYRGRRVVVTGGAGFIGSHLVDRLLDLGASVTVIDAFLPGLGANLANLERSEPHVRLERVDLRDGARLAPAVRGCELVFNLAGQVSHRDSMTEPLADLALNVEAPLSLLEVLRTSAPGAAVVHASTRQVYGRTDGGPVDEQHPIHPADVNGINKRAAEEYLRLYHEVHGVATVVLRLTNTYGPRQLVSHRRQGFIPAFVRTAMEGGCIELYGGGGQRRDANHVADVVDALVSAGAMAEEQAGEVFNLGAAPSFTLRAFAELLVSIVGRGTIAEVPWPPEQAAIDIGDFAADHQRISEALGWKPERDLAEGLAETVRFYERHGERYW
ncbi:MAG: NAD-dependent epimerase/dehydratase family protein [Acidimicrobiales bacterium]